MVRDANGIAFVVLVDAYSQLKEFVRETRPRDRMTMDVTLENPASPSLLTTSRNRVLSTDAEEAESNELVGCFETTARTKARLAESYNDNTLNGVASLFCRAWLQPRACDPIAVRLVADFMSVLHYTSYKSDAHITSYTSDPILAFGQRAHILPQFQTMLPSGVVDTRNICQIVARIFLLLVMDATSIGAEVRTNARARSGFGFARQFCDVLSFVTVLLGDNTKVLEESKLYGAWLQRWKNWKTSFSQFVTLPKTPTEDVLWKMLDRWTSGILSRNSGGADLVIPISCSDQVSFILVQVSDKEEEEDASVILALRNLEPCNFKAKHPLHNAPPHEMIRLHISPREVVTPDRPAQEGLIKQLRGVINTAWWDGTAQVEYDLNNRDHNELRRLARVLPREKAS
ncbi:hypothetical protein GQ600_12833 [Phytophthora cactorum]|nr:hypothetical protein GQ600_12833 [Phytophthora cactorum]